jgi:sn-glycerol 3-phosphate transport system ATP-binding protein
MRKSTTLRLIAGLEQPDVGQVRIGNSDVTGLTPAQRRISMVFQSYALFPHLTVAENIVFGQRVRRVARGERDARLKRVADLVGLSHLLDRKPSQLSGGQRQRVALGRAIIAESRVCLMDEPLSNLDAKVRHEMRAEIRAVVLMRDGRVEQNGSPEGLYQMPATTFAAGFIGTPPMNVIISGENQIGVRPEHIRVVSDGGKTAGVNAVEHLGADSISMCAVGNQPVVVRQEGFSKISVLASGTGVDWSVINAATVMTMAPLLIAFLIFQRQFVQSFMRAGIR